MTASARAAEFLRSAPPGCATSADGVSEADGSSGRISTPRRTSCRSASFRAASCWSSSAMTALNRSLELVRMGRGGHLWGIGQRPAQCSSRPSPGGQPDQGQVRRPAAQLPADAPAAGLQRAPMLPGVRLLYIHIQVACHWCGRPIARHSLPA